MENKILKLVLLALGIIALACVRIFEDRLFYDPFLVYFKYDYQHQEFPDYNGVKLFCGLVFRYALNMVLSLFIIYVLFRDREMLKVLGVLYGVLLVLLLMGLFGLLYFSGKENTLAFFYIRRFLIQPIFVLLFIPALYFQQYAGKKNNIL